MKNSKSSRRDFIRKAAGTALGAAALPSLAGAINKNKLVVLDQPHRDNKTYGANDQVNVAVIGMGIMGFSNAEVSSLVPGAKIVAACDLYTGRLEHAKEVYGKDLFVTKNYEEILDRKDIDAVIIATSDHWHDRISIAAMNKGKHVYCEKPMVHRLEEGADVIATQKKTGKVFQVGSQRCSSIITEKAREIYASGIIGDLVLVETQNDRHSANGAWQYSIPTDANNNTVDWDRFIGDAPKMPYDPVRFFRWRNYNDYGTGVAGDLFVHLFTGIHAVTGSHGPVRAFSTGGLRYWKDGRDAPDVMAALFDYPATDKHPAHTMQMRVNFVDGSEDGESLRLIGSEGCIVLGWSNVKVIRNKINKNPGFGGWDTFNTFTEAQQKEYEKWYRAKYPETKPEVIEPDLEYKAPERYSANLDHHLNFYAGIREGKAIKEDALFGMRAGGPALLANKSYFEKKVIHWDPEKAVVVAAPNQ
jgi:predicted dehydrogenase